MSTTRPMPHGTYGDLGPAVALDCWIAGSFVRIESLPPGVRGRLVNLLQFFLTPPPHTQLPAEPVLTLRVVRRGPDDWIVRDDEGHVVACGPIGQLPAYLEWRVVASALAVTTSHALIHGAALARDAATVLLLAPSGFGKTTLTLGLMGRGWQPLTDDIVLADPVTLGIRTLPRCFHVTRSSLVVLPVAPDLEWPGSIDGYARPLQWATGERQITAIFLVDRDPQQPSALLPITRAEAAGAILSGMVRNNLSNAQLARVASGLAAQARASYRLNNGSLAVALDLVEAESV